MTCLNAASSNSMHIRVSHGLKKQSITIGGHLGRIRSSTDPLYSPGSDFIALHNSLIVDAILTDDSRILTRKCWLQMLVQSMYNSLLPTYATSYGVLGSQETFVLKYTWELSVYFAFFVFPFVNDLAIDMDFVPGFLSRFSRLGHLNGKLQDFLMDFNRWKKFHSGNKQAGVSRLHEVRTIEASRGNVLSHRRDSRPSIKCLDDQLINLKEMAKFIIAHIYSVVLNNQGLYKWTVRQSR